MRVKAGLLKSVLRVFDPWLLVPSVRLVDGCIEGLAKGWQSFVHVRVILDSTERAPPIAAPLDWVLDDLCASFAESVEESPIPEKDGCSWWDGYDIPRVTRSERKRAAKKTAA